jgi:hypothetical protein
MLRLPGRCLSLGFLVLLSVAPLRAQLTFTFDYSLDTGNFFSGANEGRRQYLEAAGAYVSQYFTGTTLSAITPSVGNSWDVTVRNPANPSADISLGNLSIPANTVVIYAGGASLDSGVLAQAGPGGYNNLIGSSTWSNQAQRKLDLSLGGYVRTAVGSLSFSSGTSWFFDPTPQANASFAGQYDFFSVATHELLHVLGFGATQSGWGWGAKVVGGAFTGSLSLSEKSNADSGIPLNSGNTHWAQNTLSFSMRDGTSQETLMDPDIGTGVRKYLTTLDLRAMTDIGYTANYTAVPEPSTYALAAGGFCLVWAWRRRRAQS